MMDANPKHATEIEKGNGRGQKHTAESQNFKQIQPAPKALRSISCALDFSPLHDKLYDRESEQSSVYRSLDRLQDPESPREVLIISGVSGTGKTKLAQTLEEPVSQRGGLFLVGKFDQLQSPKPFAAFLQAFTRYVDITVSQGDQAVEKAKAEIQKAVGSECELLTNMIPSLELLVGKQTGGAPVPQGPEAQERFKYVFRLFVGTICQMVGQPMVIMLDDLQWADMGSLKLLHALATDPENHKNLMFVGTCRHNEVSVQDDLAATLRDIEDGGIKIKNILLHNLSEEAVTEMIFDLLHLSRRDEKVLTRFVYGQTRGNVVFIKYFLRSLVEEGMLSLDAKTSVWSWSGLSADFEIGGDVVSLLARTIQHLDEHTQEILKVAACLGANFCKSTLQHAIDKGSDASIDVFLTTTTELGLMVYECKSNNISFAHDRVQQAAYSLISEDQRTPFHLKIGLMLWERLPAEDVHEWIFIIVSQLSSGISLLDDEKEKHRIAALFLRAGEKAVLSSAFSTASTYFQHGIELLGERRWHDEYELSLALYDAAAEVAYCNGDFAMVDRCIHQVLENVHAFRDKLRAYSTKIYALGARNRLDKAIDVSFDVLRKLQEPFPSSVSTRTIVFEVLRTKWALRGKSDERLLRMPRMTDHDKSSAMKILNLVFLHAYQARPEFAPLIALRQVRLTLQYGLSPISASAMSMYGLILCSTGDADQGYRYGQLALKIQNKFGATEYVPRVYAAVYGSIHHWKMPLREGLDGSEEASKMGFLTGDIEYGALEANVYCVNALDAGMPLRDVEEKLRQNCVLFTSYNQDTELSFSRILLQGVLNLRGEAPDPLELSGEVLNELHAIEEMTAKKNVTFLCFIYLLKLWSAFIFGDYQEAKKMAALSHNIAEVALCAFDACVQCFFDGMTTLALAQGAPRGADVKTARKCLKRMRAWAKHCPSNCLHKRYLLEAEFAVLRGKHAVAMEKFTTGTVLAKEQKFLHEQAIGHERLGRYLLQRGDKTAAETELGKAVKVYETWGADGKVAAMRKELPFLET